MLKRLSRILLALVTAFVFYGQMEAAAQHCARLAEQATAQDIVHTSEPACHEAMDHASKDGSTQAPAHSKGPDTCECIAALQMCSDVVEAQAAAHIEPYAWLAPQEAAFTSTPPEPDWRPPRI